MTHPNIIIPVILSGGAGSRLWPVSRESHPKPFIQLQDGQSLLHKTFIRAARFTNAPEIITITNKEYYLKSKAEYEKAALSDAPKQSYILEPFARNTAPAILLAALKASRTYGNESILLVLPADHLIEDLSEFIKSAEQAFSLAKANHLVTFGIKPRSPETGFGYIECGEADTSTANAFRVKRFVEKPSSELAMTYCQSNQFLWNAGMFCFKVDVILNAFKQHASALFNQATICFDAAIQKNKSPDIIDFNPELFAALESISIDYAIMEKSNNIATIACHFDWRDIGSWEAYNELFTADQHGNTILGDAILIDSKNNFIHSETRMIASIGIHNLAIIDTPDAMLITHRDRAQDVKEVVQTLKNKAHQSYMTHRTVIRPWGSYTVLEEGPSFKIKRIVVKSHASLSLQMHEHRSEHWVVVEGTAKVINGDKEYLLQTNESTFVPMGTQHRLSNPTDSDVIIIEVQTGKYLGEDDITRYEDTYGRTQ